MSKTLNENKVTKITYKIWVEMITRKIGQSIDPENDVIVEIFDSWYDFFGIARNYLKQIPTDMLDDDDTIEVINIILRILNDDLRPCLTKWQSKYRKWFNHTTEQNYKIVTPQQIQESYPHYTDLLEDIINANKFCIEDMECLKEYFQ